jgi:hypothetical protein
MDEGIGISETGTLRGSALRLCNLVAQSSSQEVEKELSGRETEPWEILCFKFYKSHL